MTKFKCPKCQTENIKESTDAPGCGACGFGRDRQQATQGAAGNPLKTCRHCGVNESICPGHLLLS